CCISPSSRSAGEWSFSPFPIGNNERELVAKSQKRVHHAWNGDPRATHKDRSDSFLHTRFYLRYAIVRRADIARAERARERRALYQRGDSARAAHQQSAGHVH